MKMPFRRQHTQLHALQTKGNADDCDARLVQAECNQAFMPFVWASLYFWFRPEDVWVGGGVAFPVIVDESNGNQANILFCGIGTIVGLCGFNHLG